MVGDLRLRPHDGAIALGAVTEEEALPTGLSLEEIRSKSFVKIMAARRAKS